MRSFLNLLLEPVKRLFFKSAGLRRAAVLFIGAHAFVMAPIFSRAGLPLPDHIMYGTITISNQPVTSANTDVTVEARSSSNGPLVASYAMGSAARLGTYYYELRFQLEDASPGSPQVIVPGQQLLLSIGRKITMRPSLKDVEIIMRLQIQPLASPVGWREPA